MPEKINQHFALDFSTPPSLRETVDTDQSLSAVDLICEGPIAGVVDSDGGLVKFIDDASYSNINLGKGIYYNDVPILDTKLSKFNYVTAGYSVNTANALDKASYIPSTTYRYNEKIYLNEEEYGAPYLTPGTADLFQSHPAMFSYDGVKSDKKIMDELNYGVDIATIINNNAVSRFTNPFDDSVGDSRSFGGDFAGGKILINDINDFNFLRSRSDHDFEGYARQMDDAKLSCNAFTHKIRNHYARAIKINMNVDTLFFVKSNGTEPNDIMFCIKLFQDNNPLRYYITVPCRFVSKGQRIVPITIALNLDPTSKNSYYVEVFCLTKRSKPTDAKNNRSLALDSIVEYIGGSFNYPYSVVSASKVSSRHFKSDPVRTFDLKMLKIKVPSNYDPVAKTYDGHWNGAFSNFLKWTDNPAWIYYDICTNQRYGVGTGKVSGEDLNKWELYKIARYCDELIESTSSRAYEPDEFSWFPQTPESIYISKVSSNGIAVTLESLEKKYKPVMQRDGQVNDETGIPLLGARSENQLADCLIFLFDLNNSELENQKKVLWQIVEGNLTFDDDNNPNFEQTEVGKGGCFKVLCGPDFGPEEFFANDTEYEGVSIFENFKKRLVSDSSYNLKSKQSLKNLINAASINSERGAKNHILSFIAQNWYKQGWTWLNDKYFQGQSIFTQKEAVTTTISGKCLPRVKGYRDPLEPRFKANLYIDNETEALKLLNDLASIFRGLTYYRNNLINTTIDVKKETSYLFNNTNVKDGIFQYSTGSIDGNYSVAKVLFRDEFNKFSEEVEVVEDSELIKEFGIVSKEILGFGVTSRDQARRMGLWLLATNRFENQTVTFTTDIQGLLLKPGDVIQIEDSYKNNTVLQGRVLGVNIDEDDPSNNYVVVDRKIDTRFINEKIKFLFRGSYADSDSVTSSEDYEDSLRLDVALFVIERIENDTNRIYLKYEGLESSYNEDALKMFARITVATPFIIQGDTISSSSEPYGLSGSNVSEKNDDSDNKNLYKIVSLGEQDINEYAIFAIKYDRNKYLSLDQNLIKIQNDYGKSIAKYNSSENVREIDLTSMFDDETSPQGYYDIARVGYSGLKSIEIDYSFSENSSPLSMSSSVNFAVLNLDIISIFTHIESRSSSDDYFQKIQQVLEESPNCGLLCKITYDNRSIKFKNSMQIRENKSIFIGLFPVSQDNSYIFSSECDVKFYLYNAENRIIEV